MKTLFLGALGTIVLAGACGGKILDDGSSHHERRADRIDRRRAGRRPAGRNGGSDTDLVDELRARGRGWNADADRSARVWLDDV